MFPFMSVSVGFKAKTVARKEPLVVEFDDTAYIFTHGKAPRGYGSWAFSDNKNPKGDGSDVFWFNNNTLSQAKRKMVAKLREMGITGHVTVFVLT